MTLEVGDVVLATVDRIIGTVVFVKIDSNSKDLEGSIILSEIAPGRIRNIRNYVVPKKKIVCKVLRISKDRIDLSLRRVTQKEKKELMEQYKQEKSHKSIIKSVLGEKANSIIKEILKEERVYDFLQASKTNPKKLEKLVGKKESEKIIDILKKQKQKKAIVKKILSLTTTKPNGLELIKDLFKEIKNAEIKYFSAGKYSIKTEAEDLKTADKRLKEIIDEIEKISKKLGFEFNIKEK